MLLALELYCRRRNLLRQTASEPFSEFIRRMTSVYPPPNKMLLLSTALIGMSILFALIAVFDRQLFYCDELDFSWLGVTINGIWVGYFGGRWNQFEQVDGSPSMWDKLQVMEVSLNTVMAPLIIAYSQLLLGAAFFFFAFALLAFLPFADSTEEMGIKKIGLGSVVVGCILFLFSHKTFFMNWPMIQSTFELLMYKEEDALFEPHVNLGRGAVFLELATWTGFLASIAMIIVIRTDPFQPHLVQSAQRSQHGMGEWEGYSVGVRTDENTIDEKIAVQGVWVKEASVADSADDKNFRRIISHGEKLAHPEITSGNGPELIFLTVGGKNQVVGCETDSIKDERIYHFQP